MRAGDGVEADFAIFDPIADGGAARAKIKIIGDNSATRKRGRV